MSERHTKGARRYCTTDPAPGNSRSAMTQASDSRPPKYYDPARAHIEPPAVTAARERYRAHEAEMDALAAREATPDPAPGYEWQRELGDDGE